MLLRQLATFLHFSFLHFLRFQNADFEITYSLIIYFIHCAEAENTYQQNSKLCSLLAQMLFFTQLFFGVQLHI